MGAQENVVNNNEDRLPPEAKRMLQSLASNWEDVIDSNALQMIRLKGAMTNEVYQIKWPTRSGELSRKVLVRIYGEGVEVFFNREDEIRTFECMSKHGQGPRLLGRFPNGRIEEFIRARTLSSADLRDLEISGLIAAKLREFNGLDMPGSKKVILWDRLRNWLGAAKTMCPLEEVVAFSLNKFDEEISLLEKELGGDHQRLGFSHNDLQYGNIMIEEVSRSITIIQLDCWRKAITYDHDHGNKGIDQAVNYNSVIVILNHVYSSPHKLLTCILGFPCFFHPGMKRKIQKYQDYEYAGYAPVAYDIANHFCEMAADYHTETPHVMDYNKYPGLEERKRFVYTYMSSSGGPPSDLEVEQLLKDVEKYTLVSHLLWGLWGIISEHVNEIDFNYKEYASQRFQQYWSKKQAVFGSSAAPSHNTAKNRV